MTIFSDAAGFKYFGDCQWGTLNIDYPTQYYLEALPTANIDTARPGISTALTNLCTQAGLAFRNVATQATFDARVGLASNAMHFLWFGANGDIDDRYSFGVNTWTSNTSNSSNVNIFNDSGSTGTDPTASPVSNTTNRLYYLGPLGVNTPSAVNVSFGVPSGTVSPVYWVGASDGQYLALFLFQRNWGTDAVRTNFFYAGQLANVNTGYNYYSASNTTKTISLCQLGGSSVSAAIGGGHYIANAAKATLQYSTVRDWAGMTTLGSDIYACDYGGDIYKQIAGTEGWTALGQTARNWTAMTTLGSDVYACVYTGDIYKQTNGTGNFVALGQTTRGWYGMTTLGTDIYATVNNGDIYKQTNGTGNFVALGQTTRNWRHMTTLGTDVYATVNNGDIYKQTNGTGNFVALNQTTRNWYGMTTLGTDVYACVFGGDIYKQTNGTGNFVGELFNPAMYPIVCSDSQTPTSQWVTDMYVFDNNQTLGFPAMGRVRGMLLGTGTYTLGKPVKIQGSVFPDGGSQWYLPVGTYSGKVLLMRCYSSMS